jgi:hypothetical protein
VDEVKPAGAAVARLKMFSEEEARDQLQKFLLLQKERRGASFRELASATGLSLTVVANLFRDDKSQLSLLKLLQLIEELGLEDVTLGELGRISRGEQTPESLRVGIERREDDAMDSAAKVIKSELENISKLDSDAASEVSRVRAEIEEALREAKATLQRELENVLRSGRGTDSRPAKITDPSSDRVVALSRRRTFIDDLKLMPPSREAHDTRTWFYRVTESQASWLKNQFEGDHVIQIMSLSHDESVAAKSASTRSAVQFKLADVFRLTRNDDNVKWSKVLILAALSSTDPRRYHTYFGESVVDSTGIFSNLERLDQILWKVVSSVRQGDPVEAFARFEASKRGPDHLHGLGRTLIAEFIYFMGHGQANVPLAPVPLSLRTERQLERISQFNEDAQRFGYADYRRYLKVFTTLSQETQIDPDLIEAALREYRF